MPAAPWNRLATAGPTTNVTEMLPATRSRTKTLRRLALAALAFLPLASTAEAAPTPGNKIKGKGGNFGAGISLGDPMGGSIKYFMAPNHAIQADIGWAPLHHGHGRLGFDYLWHPGTFVSNSTLDFLPYLGLGLGMMFWAGGYYYAGHGGRCCNGAGCDPDCRYYYDYRRYDRGGVAMFLRAPILGLGFHWKKAPLDTMLEGSWSPYLIYPDLAHGDFSFKIRYYF